MLPQSLGVVDSLSTNGLDFRPAHRATQSYRVPCYVHHQSQFGPHSCPRAQPIEFPRSFYLSVRLTQTPCGLRPLRMGCKPLKTHMKTRIPCCLRKPITSYCHRYSSEFQSTLVLSPSLVLLQLQEGLSDCRNRSSPTFAGPAKPW